MIKLDRQKFQRKVEQLPDRGSLFFRFDMVSEQGEEIVRDGDLYKWGGKTYLTPAEVADEVFWFTSSALYAGITSPS